MPSTDTGTAAEQLRRERIREAAAQHADHPQYLARLCDCTDGLHGVDRRVTLDHIRPGDTTPTLHGVAGHWHYWQLAEILDTVTANCGVAFQRGDVVLARPELAGTSAGVICYSFRTCLDTLVPQHKVRWRGES